MAPLDIIFFGNGTTAFVSFHGSWYVLPKVIFLTMLTVA
jgi:hypothetical protein